jgi:hypothetical protein
MEFVHRDDVDFALLEIPEAMLLGKAGLVHVALMLTLIAMGDASRDDPWEGDVDTVLLDRSNFTRCVQSVCGFRVVRRGCLEAICVRGVCHDLQACTMVPLV